MKRTLKLSIILLTLCLFSTDVNAAKAVTVNVKNGETLTTSNTISTYKDIIKRGQGTWVINGNTSNTNTGTTILKKGTIVLDKCSEMDAIAGDIIIRGGTLILDKNNQINDTSNLTIKGGSIFSLNDQDESLGSLTLSNNAAYSTFDLGNSVSDGSIIKFSNSSNNSWSSGQLNIEHWNGSTSGGGIDQIYFGNSTNGLTSDQIGQIYFINPYGFGGGVYGATMLPTGELIPITAIPESSTWIYIGLLALLVIFDSINRSKWWRRFLIAIGMQVK